ncbi:hypothetical protein SAMN05660199_01001 [Klenkia soli]|uniref:DUF7660 domain-containing protein n=1 Tax=Klenkia soli TaxID=1052260 RepID=A0A1H0FS19_9ACTN|nr:hypothetical protein [Klenkia soli]SDN97341.1 hypothetical protein SAMN05660199_01001 [Klenkia soli]
MAWETGRFADISVRTVEQVRSQGDLADVVRCMRADLQGSGQREWENATLDRFLDALAAVAEGRTEVGKPTWSTVAELLVAATGYE